MDSPLFDQQEADREIIESLIKTTRILWRELEEKRDMLKLHQSIKQGPVMNKIMQDLKGAYALVKEYEPLTKEIAEKIIAEGKVVAENVQHDLQMAEKFLQEEVAKLSGQNPPAAPSQSEQMTVAADQIQITPAADTTQPTDQGQATPAANPEVPAPVVNPPAEQPAAPAADPNAAPAQPQATPADPNLQIQ